MQGEMGERDDTAGGVVVSSLIYRFWRNTALVKGPCHTIQVKRSQLTDTNEISSSRAFTSLVADRQFSTLGVVLIAVLARIGKIVGLPESERHLLDVNSDGEKLLASSTRETGQDTGEIIQREYVEDVGKIIEMEIDGAERGIAGRREKRSPSKRRIAKEADRPIDLDSGGLEENETVAQEGDTLEVHSIQPVTMPKSQGKKHENDSNHKKHKKHKKRNVIDDLFGHLV